MEEQKERNAAEESAEAEEAVAESGVSGEESSPEAEQEETPAIPVAKGRPHRPGGEVRFENDFTITQEIYQEFMKTFTRPYRRIYSVTGGIALVLSVLSFLGASVSSGTMMLIVGILCFAMPVIQTGGSRKKKYAAQVTKNGGKPLERKVLFYEDGLEAFSNNNAHTVFDYGDITKVICSENLYALVMERKLSLLVLKDSFSKGDLEEWKQFMATKGSWKIR